MYIFKNIKYFFYKKERNFFLFLKDIIGFYPRKLSIYKLAFLHKSVASKNNERLEFLGDAILSSVVADFLYKKFPYKKEGFLTKIRSRIVSRNNLNFLAKKLKLYKFMTFLNVKDSKNIYGNTLEALIGAIFIDKGYEKTKKFIIKKIIDKYIDLNEIQKKDINFKSQLLELVQKNKKEMFFETKLYIFEKNKFISKVFVNNEELGIGFGSSKKEAEQKASKESLKIYPK